MVEPGIDATFSAMPRAVAAAHSPTLPRRKSRAWRRVAAVALSVGVSLGVFEVALRMWYPAVRLISDEKLDMYLIQASQCVGYLQADATLGHAPVLGGTQFDALGLLPGFRTATGTRERVPGVERILFLGDSVTARARIIAALRALRPRQLVEYLNAGVEGWSVVQEVEYYFRQHRALPTDHVVVTLHNNDLTYTRTALYDDGAFTLCRPDNTVRLVPWLYRVSWIYRLLVNARIRDRWTPADYVALAEPTAAALRRLRDDLVARGVRLTVVVFPILADRKTWNGHELESRRLCLEMLRELRIDTVDLTAGVEDAVRAGIPIREGPDDPWHPGPLGGVRLAQEILASGFLGDEKAWVASDATVVPAGGAQHLTIDAGRERAGLSFRILGAEGLAPEPFLVQTARIVLAPDAYFAATLTGKEAGITNGGLGQLDAEGRAAVEVTAPAPDAVGPQGATRWHTCVVHGAQGEIVAVSSAVPMLVFR